MQNLADEHDTALNCPAVVPLPWIRHLNPPQRSTSVCTPAASMKNPTAVHALTDVQETPSRIANLEPAGTATRWEEMLAIPSLPFESAASGRVPEFPVTPTSSHLVVVGHDAALSTESPGRSSGSPLTGIATCQSRPFHISGSATSLEPLVSKPAATHRLADGHETPDKTLKLPGFLVT